MENPNNLLAKIETVRHLWAYFHKDWLLEIRQLLRPQLSSDYHVFIESETVLVSPDNQDSDDRTLPDLAVTHSGQHIASAGNEPAGATAAVVELVETVELFSKYSLVIRRSPDQQLLAVLELLSPSNKGLGNRTDRGKYLRKRDDYLEAGISFLEIDALLKGQRLFLDPLKHLADYQRNAAWTAFLDDSGRRLRGYGWSAEQPLPKLPWWIDNRQVVLVDLDAAARAAFAFNQWESLVGK